MLNLIFAQALVSSSSFTVRVIDAQASLQQDCFHAKTLHRFLDRNWKAFILDLFLIFSVVLAPASSEYLRGNLYLQLDHQECHVTPVPFVVRCLQIRGGLAPYLPLSTLSLVIPYFY